MHFCPSSLPLPIKKNLSKLKVFVEDSFEFDEKGRKFSKWVENTVGNGEIAHSEQNVKTRSCLGKS